MKLKHLLAFVAVGLVGVWLFTSALHQKPKMVSAVPLNVTDNPVSTYSSIASRSSKALVQTGKSQIQSVHVSNDTNVTQYFSLYDSNTVTGFASKTRLQTFEIPPATSTASPSFVIIPSNYFVNLDFNSGLLWSMSSSAVYASASTNAAKYLINIIYY